MMRAALLSLLLALWPTAPSLAGGIVFELSDALIEVTADFDGSDIVIFGVIERDRQSVARGGESGVAVAVLGPAQDVLVQRRVRRFGFWATGQQQRFQRFPSFVALKSTDGLERETAEQMLNERIRPTRGAPVAAEPFRDALIAARAETGLYNVEEGAVTMLTPAFFRTRIRLPGTAADGDYTVSASLFSDGLPLDVQTTTFTVRKVGFEQRVFALSQDEPALYGLLAVALALFTGYVGGVVFRRN
mgnify:CR=1 FL=1